MIDLTDIKLILLDLRGVLIDSTEEIESVEFFNDLKKLCDAAGKYQKSVGIISGSAVKLSDQILNSAGVGLIINSTIDKVTAMEKFLDSSELEYQDILYIGDDVLDIPLLNKAGIGAAPGNSPRSVKRTVDFVFRSRKRTELVEELISYLNKPIS